MRLAGQQALVTGGGTGIGAAIARALAAEDATVTVMGRRRELLEAIAREIGGTAIAADVTDRGAIDRVIADAGPFTILVNNAGLAESAPFAKVTEDAWRQVLAVNLDAVFHCSQAALPGMLAAGHGRIVTIASIAGLRGAAYVAPYVAAKHGAVGLMRALAEELRSKGVTANAVCPGYADTEIVAAAARNIQAKTGRSAEEARAELARFNPSGRLIAPEEVADAVVELVLSNRTGEAMEIA
ncbi:MAG: SDR family NAD(P)-dependent oxidoreductase [Sphingomonas sp.]|uniref:SDR family NAD(P)-dependent oxidoreductase n=1 Tax=Sphingomonas sp. TaxID=28214 RepID=UPI0025DABAE8|nr:SDR family NAD(P)-dependent oxidoreductase [Sphingomonas sp.]MBX3563656.1 SDR family NAD(P)-dependent oxidoreductase [Sphingomonas sp.]